MSNKELNKYISERFLVGEIRGEESARILSKQMENGIKISNDLPSNKNPRKLG